MNSLIEKLPLYARRVKEIDAIMQTVSEEFKLLNIAIDQALDNMFIDSADEYGIARLERILSISPPSSATLEERRFAVKSKWNAASTLKQQLDELCQYTYQYDKEMALLNIGLDLKSRHNLNTVKEMLSKNVSPNITLNVYILYTTYGLLGSITHQQLSGYAHGQIAVLDLNA